MVLGSWIKIKLRSQDWGLDSAIPLSEKPPVAVVLFLVDFLAEDVEAPGLEGQGEGQEDYLVHGQGKEEVDIMRRVIDGFMHQTQCLQVTWCGHRQSNCISHCLVETFKEHANNFHSRMMGSAATGTECRQRILIDTKPHFHIEPNGMEITGKVLLCHHSITHRSLFAKDPKKSFQKKKLIDVLFSFAI